MVGWWWGVRRGLVVADIVSGSAAFNVSMATTRAKLPAAPHLVFTFISLSACAAVTVAPADGTDGIRPGECTWPCFFGRLYIWVLRVNPGLKVYELSVLYTTTTS